MSRHFVSAIIGAALAVVGAISVSAANEKNPAVDLLFETKHITAIAPGTELVYKFERKPSNEAVLGKGFTDDIKVKIESDAGDGKKNVMVQIYSGERAREPHRITEMDGNPMLVVYLDNAVAHFKELAGGDRSYLKNTFSKDIGKSGKLDPVSITYKGETVPGYRVSLTPYINDPAKSKMRGFEGAQFSIFVSEKVPGYFAKMVSSYTNSGKDAPTLEEVTTLDGVGEVK
ncbi:MAG: hypothetical protein ACKVP4_10895 [Hyphomicrobium sp.]